MDYKIFRMTKLKGLGQVIESPSTPKEKKIQIPTDAPVTKARVRKVLDTLRGQTVIARDQSDGLYYPGAVVKCIDSRHALVQFVDKSRLKVPTRLIIPTGGAIPSPALQFGDYVLVRVINTETGLECFVPGIIQVPPRAQGNQAKFYTILMYNGQKATTMRSYLVKISKSRFEFTIMYIAEVQNEDREIVRETVYASPRKTTSPSSGRPVRPKSAKWSIRARAQQQSDSKSRSSSRSRSTSGSRSRSRSRSRSSSRSSSQSSSRSGTPRNSSRSSTPQKEVERSREISRGRPRSRSRSSSRSKSPQRSRSSSSNSTGKDKNNTNHSELFRAKEVVIDASSQKRLEELQEQLKKQKDRQEIQQQKLKKQMTKMKQMKKKMKKEKEEHSSLLRQILYRQESLEKLQQESTKEPSREKSKTKSEDKKSPRKKETPVQERALPSLLKMRTLLPPLREHEEVLARWADDGWYFRGIVCQDCGDFSYLIEDSTGSSERIWREDIISDKDDAGNIVQPKETVVALHPSYSFSYAPATVLEVYENLWMQVRFFDGEEEKLPREEVYRIPIDKFKHDVNYIKTCEKELLNQAVVARNDQTGLYELGSVKERLDSGKDYELEWCDGSRSSQSVIHIFGPKTKKRPIAIGDQALAVVDQQQMKYLPGSVLAIHGNQITVKFCTGAVHDEIDATQSYWLSRDYYDHAVKFIQTLHSDET